MEHLRDKIFINPFQGLEERTEDICFVAVAGLIKSFLIFLALSKESGTFIIKIVLFRILSYHMRETLLIELKLLFLETFFFWLLQKISSLFGILLLCFCTHEKTTGLMQILCLESFISFILKSILRLSDNVFIIFCVLSISICYTCKDKKKTVFDLMLGAVLLLSCCFSMNYQVMSSNSTLFDIFILSVTWLILKS